MSNFNENTRVQVPAALHLCKLGYTYLEKIDALDTGTNIIIDVFLESVKNLNPGISGTEVSILFSKIVSIANNDDLGREFYQLLSANSGIKLIDFDNPEVKDELYRWGEWYLKMTGVNGLRLDAVKHIIEDL